MAKVNWRKKGAKKLQDEEKKNAEQEAPKQEQPETAEEAKAEEKTEAKAETETKTGAKEATAEEWEAALRTAVAQRDEYLQLAQRTQADFANFRRRNQTVRADAYDDGVRETLAAMLPVIDNLERAISALGEDDNSPLGSGVRMTMKQLQNVCTKLGLEEVAAKKGDPFDPELHNAVMRGDEGEPGTIIDCFEKGYRVKGRMIRYATVKVHAED